LRSASELIEYVNYGDGKGGQKSFSTD